MPGERPAQTDPARPTKQARRRRSSGIGVPIARSRFLVIAVAVFVGLGLAWWAATGLGLVKPIFLPSPGSVAMQIAKLAADGTLWLDLKASMYRISIGFLIASALSIPIGVLIGSFRSWEAAIEPLVDFIRYMPVVAFVPLSILWAGTGDSQKFLIIFIGTFFQQVLMIMDNVKRVPADFIGLGRTLGLPDRKILTRIVVPSALPGIWDTLRISLGWAWTWLVLAELVAATSGLGYRITVSQRYFQTNTIIGYILLLGLLGLITDQVMKALEKVLFKQEGRSQ
ncbi:ABC transporter permease [Mesorhizobium sp. M7A.F.Ca.CA.001.09.2.1]|uniref:Binding-protein-dependent transport systems inner membrane component n=1 Tax=Mesorhizobium ciceri biovar biserrulae (strain HAMBI 2942 / LMG 23838 / WSM1271) TaxID=765698 RepID=E8T8N2_MESCW|nr:binding-protein-dependent transport systems inner membrane component [Mesorhizobium ciceri biovar biserrulae WSM1271]AMX94171.1 nitrate transport permease nrtB [Mesorhizobium ciceri]AMY03732.1 nitrate transport permease nrtB [Mesorhizobium ciceri biovar biserrulae]RUU20231.1 ABC transporter permease [Mesorhizobium sp. Primo-B]RUU36753.1 ABC transporter permease [Mesorhizobium sp. Primo-A]RUX17159.1 ABC transporter permease [Mesorhizobium sp. M7A.F.Ca.CA.002.14.1.2]RUX41729.1 ABC transporte